MVLVGRSLRPGCLPDFIAIANAPGAVAMLFSGEYVRDR
jgi:hypothetical protein